MTAPRNEARTQQAPVLVAGIASPIAHGAILVLLASAGYFFSAQLGYAFAVRPSGVSVVWMPAGVMLALLLVQPRRDWLTTLVGGFLGNVAADLVHGIALPKALMGGVANGLEVFVAAAVVVRWAGPVLALNTTRHVGALVIGAALVSNALTAMLGAAVIAYGRPGFWRGWFVWWTGDGMGMLVVAPALLAWLALIRARPKLSWRPIGEAVLVLAALAWSSALILSRSPDPTRLAGSDAYMVFPLLFWAAFRFGPLGASTATLTVTIITIWNAALGRGPFTEAGYTPTNEVLQIFAYLGLAALSTMIVAAVVSERQAAEADTASRSRHAAFAADVATAVTEDEPLRDVLHRCAVAITRDLDARQACMWMVNEADGVLSLQACAGPVTGITSRDRIPLGQSIAGQAAIDGQVRVVSGLALAELRSEAGLPDDIATAAVFPLNVNGRIQGIIGLTACHPLSERTLETLATSARTIALGIERRRLQDARAHLVGILDAASDFVTISPIEGPPLYVNPAARRALGVGMDEAVPSLLALRPAGFADFLHTTIIAGADTYGSWRGETQYVSRDGRSIPVSQVSVAHKDVNGRIVFLSTISRDITERLRAERALREAEERLRFALEASGVGVWEVNMETGTAYWSETCERMHGLTPGTFDRTFEAFLDRVADDDRSRVADTIATAIRRHEDAVLEYRTTLADGTTRHISSTGRFVYKPDGTPVRGAGVTADVTERRSLEAQLLQSQKMDAIGQLAGGIAHDFNNLITAILGYAELIADTLPDTDERRSDVEEIQRASQRAAQLTRQLLAFSRKQILEPRVLRLGEVVSGLVPMLRRLIGEAIDLRTIIADRGLVKADVGQMEQVLVNVVVNARDAMPDGGRLTIETSDVVADSRVTTGAAPSPSPHVALTVTDTGHGMDEATRQRVFEPFFTTKPKGSGTGLGLATVHGIVAQSGGRIDVTSEIGRGTSFRVLLPRTDDTPKQPDAHRPAQPGSIATETVLLVEDEQVVREFVHRILTRSGYVVHAFADPQRALAFTTAHTGPIDAILTDVVLPGMDGKTMADTVRRGHPTASVLYMSGYTDAAIVRQGALEPGVRFLQKPFNAESLQAAMRDLLGAPGATTRSTPRPDPGSPRRT